MTFTSLSGLLGRELKIHDNSMSKESYRAGAQGIKEKSKHLNRVRSYQSQSDLEPHLIIKGTVKFRNTDGYLSAQKYPNIQYHAMFLALFTSLSFLWTFGMK
jgi:hypothetical protein